MNNKGNLLLFYFNRTGCLSYTREMLHHLSGLNPVPVVRPSNAALKTENGYLVFIPDTIPGLLLYAPFFLFFKIIPLLYAYKRKGHHTKVYLTAFHPYNVLLSWACVLFNLPLFITIHDFQSHPGEKSRITEYIQKHCAALAYKSIFLSKNEAEKARSQGLNISKIIRLDHPFPDLPQQHNLSFDLPLKLLFIGRIKKYKGIQILLDAVKALDSVRLTVAGEGDWSALDLPENVQLIKSRLPEKQFHALMRTHHFIVLPYIHASQSGVLCHALACGAPLVLTDIPGLNEQISNEAAIFCQPDSQSLRQVIRSVDAESYARLKLSVKEELEKRKREWNKQFDRLYTLLELTQ